MTESTIHGATIFLQALILSPERVGPYIKELESTETTPRRKGFILGEVFVIIRGLEALRSTLARKTPETMDEMDLGAQDFLNSPEASRYGH